MVSHRGVSLPPIFNVYTNDQPVGPDTSSFIYADDLALTAQGINFEEVEDKLTLALKNMSEYYNENGLKPNPSKTNVCASHLKNRQARCRLAIIWGGVSLTHCEMPCYLGVTLDQTLTFKRHCCNLKQKISTSNNLRKLAGITWGAHPTTLCTAGLAFCYSVEEYACPVWSCSVHTM